MAPAFTLHQGDRDQEFVEHPVVAAGRALMAAADLESDEWPQLFRRIARALPRRDPLPQDQKGEA